MDPSTTFNNIVNDVIDLSVIQDSEVTAAIRESLSDNLRNFAEWIEGGGFIPNHGDLVSILEDQSRRL